MDKYYIALNPEKRLYNLVNTQKSIVKTITNQVKYIDHPPHFTLVIFTTENLEDIKQVLEDLSKEIKKIKITIKDFHIFYNDAFTNGNTISYNLSEKDNFLLRALQLKIINSINKFNSKKFLLKTDNEYNKLSEIEKNNLESYGYPYVGDIWIPHITIVSVSPEDFQEVFNKLRKEPIKEEYLIESVSLYKVGEETSTLIKSFKLG